LRSDEALTKRVANLLKESKEEELISLVVDHTKTIKQAIADGNYDCVNNDIADNFGSNEIGVSTEVAKLFHFNYVISSGDAISEMNKAGYRPATLMELLALGILFPELQRQFSIVALGSVWRLASDYRCVPYLHVHGSERGLSLDWFGRDWSARYRFLGVRK